MSRCGCSSDACTCVVNGAGLATVTGTGTPNNPCVVSATCTSVRSCFTAGDGIDIVDGVISAEPLDCEDVRACFTPGDNITIVDGVITGTFDCEEARACFMGGDSIDLDVTTGQIDLCLSTDPLNAAVLGTDGCLFVPPGGAGTATLFQDGNGTTLTGDGVVTPYAVNVVPGCGIEVTDDTVAANTADWTLPCDQDTAATPIFCSPTTGQLQGFPRDNYDFFGINMATDFNDIVVTSANSPQCVIGEFDIDATDWCQSGVFVGTMISQWNVNPDVGADFAIAGAISLNGGPFNGVGQMFQVNNSDGTPDNRITTNGVATFSIPAGTIVNLRYRVCLNVTGGSVTLGILRSQFRGPGGTRNP